LVIKKTKEEKDRPDRGRQSTRRLCDAHSSKAERRTIERVSPSRSTREKRSVTRAG